MKMQFKGKVRSVVVKNYNIQMMVQMLQIG